MSLVTVFKIEFTLLFFSPKCFLQALLRKKVIRWFADQHILGVGSKWQQQNNPGRKSGEHTHRVSYQESPGWSRVSACANRKATFLYVQAYVMDLQRQKNQTVNTRPAGDDSQFLRRWYNRMLLLLRTVTSWKTAVGTNDWFDVRAIMHLGTVTTIQGYKYLHLNILGTGKITTTMKSKRGTSWLYLISKYKNIRNLLQHNLLTDSWIGNPDFEI